MCEPSRGGRIENSWGRGVAEVTQGLQIITRDRLAGIRRKLAWRRWYITAFPTGDGEEVEGYVLSSQQPTQ